MPNVEFMRSFPGDPAAKSYARFWLDEEVEDPVASRAHGRPIMRPPVEMIEIRFPGNNLTVIARKVTNEDRALYKAQYDAFKEHGKEVISGTPLRAWPALSRGQVKEFESLNIMSVEMLAAIDDAGIQRVGMGGRIWRDRAKVFLEAAADASIADRLATDKALLQEQLETANRQIAELATAVRALQAQSAAQLSVADHPGLAVSARVVPPAPVPVQPSALEADGGYIEPKRVAKKA